MLRLVLAACVGLIPAVGLADEISGEWCSPDGESLTIKGRRVIAPSGIETDGQYSRHRYEFVMPEGGAGAGAVIVIQQLSDEEVEVSTDGSAPVSWSRCRAVSS